MELLIEQDAQGARWPLAFRAAVALVAGLAAGWALAGWATSADDAPRAIDADALDPRVVIAALAVTAFLLFGGAALASRMRAVRSLLVVAASAAAGIALACRAGGTEPASGDRTVEGPVTLHGIVATAPRVDDGGTDRLGRFAIREASQSFTLAVRSVESGGMLHAADTELRVQVAGLAPLPPRGSAVRVRGWHRPHAELLNPGRRIRSGPGSIDVTSSTLVVAEPPGLLDGALIAIRRAANDALLRAQPPWSDPGTIALVAAMTTGARHPGLTEGSASFRAAGLSHVLAISGFNVAVLVAGAGAVASLAGARMRARAAVSIGVAVAFLALTEPDTSVLRAGLGAGVAAVAGLRGGQARGLGTLGIVAIATLLVDPAAAAGAGFQLSYGVVVGLLAIAPTVAVRWTIRLDRWWAGIRWPSIAKGEACTLARHALVSATVASLVAWTVSTPIAAWHSGTINAWAAPLSILTMPAAAITTIAGVVSMLAVDLAPTAGQGAGAVAAAAAMFLREVARMASDAPGGIVWVGLVPAWCSAASAFAVVTAWSARRQAIRIVAWMIAASLAWGVVAGIFAPAGGGIPDGALCIDSLALGRGSCHVIRCGGATIVFDAGAMGDPSAGSRRIVPMLASLGVRNVDACVVGSRSLVSCAAIPEVMRAFGSPMLAADRRSIDGMRRARDGASSVLLAEVAGRGARVHAFDDGDVLDIGPLEVTAHVAAENPARGRKGDQGGLVITVRHRDWPDQIPSMVVASDDADAILAGLPAPVLPDRSALRRVRERTGRTTTQAWTAGGWR